ncbi:hypothetical protein WJX84_007997 [Apatococcus fuscideae]|uniref:Uncharacterized protein n=1 Tax=Apatococcus fuscideae TaxID=2026836 RepID=A0AAW1SWR1_9CHLO
MRDVTALGGASTALRTTTEGDFLWKQLAEAKWGAAVRDLAEKEVTSRTGHWREYCQRRMCLKDPRQSPLDLIQEAHTDPWRHLVCCQLFSRTTGGPVVKTVIAAFLKSYTTPTSILQAEAAEIEVAINSLGMQEMRRKALKRMSEGFLSLDWQLPSELFGCGSFADESWSIFCRGQTNPRGITDRFLRQYLTWLRTGKSADDKQERPAKVNVTQLKPQHLAEC